MFRQLIAVLVVALCVGAGVTTAQTTQNQAAAGDTFIWHAELVSVDAGSATFTVKAMMLSDTAKEVARFNAGDRVLQILHASIVIAVGVRYDDVANVVRIEA